MRLYVYIYSPRKRSFLTALRGKALLRNLIYSAKKHTCCRSFGKIVELNPQKNNMISQEHQSLFDEIAAAASTEESLLKAKSILAEWWSEALVRNIPKRGVKKELIESLSYHTNEK